MKIRILSQEELAQVEALAVRAENEKYVVRLSAEERGQLDQLRRKGKVRAQTLRRAEILLKADASEEGPDWTDDQIRVAFGVGLSTIARVRRAFVDEGREVALHGRRPQRESVRKLDGTAEAHLIALTCGTPPTGQQRWTLRLLAEKLVELDVVDSVSHETVRQVLKKTNSSRGKKSSG